VSERGVVNEASAAATATTSTSVARGGIWNTAAAVVPQLYTLAISIVAARVLGPDDMGRQSFIGFVAVVVSIIVAAGFPIAVTRHVAEQLGAGRAETLPDLVRWAWKLAAGGASTAFVGLDGLCRSNLTIGAANATRTQMNAANPTVPSSASICRKLLCAFSCAFGYTAMSAGEANSSSRAGNWPIPTPKRGRVASMCRLMLANSARILRASVDGVMLRTSKR